MAYKYISFNMIQTVGGNIVLTDFYKTLSYVTPFEFFYEYQYFIDRFPEEFFEGVCIGLKYEEDTNDFLIQFLKDAQYDDVEHQSRYINEIRKCLNNYKRVSDELEFFSFDGQEISDGGVNVDKMKPYLLVPFSQVEESKVLSDIYEDGVIVPRTFIKEEQFNFFKEEIEAKLKGINKWKKGNLNEKIDVFYGVLMERVIQVEILLPCCDLAGWLTKNIFENEGYKVEFRYAVYMKTSTPSVFGTVQIEDKDTHIKYLFDPMIRYTYQAHYETFFIKSKQKDGGHIDSVKTKKMIKKDLKGRFNFDEFLKKAKVINFSEEGGGYEYIADEGRKFLFEYSTSYIDFLTIKMVDPQFFNKKVAELSMERLIGCINLNVLFVESEYRKEFRGVGSGLVWVAAEYLKSKGIKGFTVRVDSTAKKICFDRLGRIFNIKFPSILIGGFYYKIGARNNGMYPVFVFEDNSIPEINIRIKKKRNSRLFRRLIFYSNNNSGKRESDKDGGSINKKELIIELNKVLIRLDYPQNAIPLLVNEFEVLFSEINFLELYEKASSIDEAQSLKIFLKDLYKLLDANKYNDCQNPRELIRLLVSSLGALDPFISISESRAPPELKIKLNQILVSCVSISQLGYIILTLLGLNIIGINAPRHTLNLIPLDKNKHLIVDFTWGIVESIEITDFYKKEPGYWLLKEKYFLKSKQLAEFFSELKKNNFIIADFSKEPSLNELLNFLYLYMHENKELGLSPNIYNNLAAIFRDVGNYEEAINLFSKAIESDPEYAQPYYGLGNTFAFLAMAEEERLFLNPLEIEIVYGHIQNYFSEAVKLFLIAITRNPYYSEAYDGLGNVLMSLSQYSKEKNKYYEKAVENYEKAIQFNSFSITHYTNLSNVYKRLGEFDKVVEILETFTVIDPDSALGWYNFGNAYFDLGRKKEAVVNFVRAVNLMSSLLSVVPDNILLEVARKYSDQPDGGSTEVKNIFQRKGFSLSEAEIIIEEVNYIIDKLKLEISPEERETILLKFKPYTFLDFIRNNKRFFIWRYSYFLSYFLFALFIRVGCLNKEINNILLALIFLIPLVISFISVKKKYGFFSGDLSKGRGKRLENLDEVKILCKSGMDIDLFREAVVHELTHYLGTAGYIKMDLYLATALGEYRTRELNKETEFSRFYEKYYLKGFALGDEIDVFMRERKAKEFCDIKNLVGEYSRFEYLSYLISYKLGFVFDGAFNYHYGCLLSGIAKKIADNTLDTEKGWDYLREKAECG